MNFNVGDFMFDIIKTLTKFTQKLYEIVNYKFSLKWLSTALKIFNNNIELPENITLLGILGILSVGTLAILIVYNIFRG